MKRKQKTFLKREFSYSRQNAHDGNIKAIQRYRSSIGKESEATFSLSSSIYLLESYRRERTFYYVYCQESGDNTNGILG
jgi:hypothetical protein